MRKGMFGKLAVQNIRNNRSTYVPYMLTCIFCIAMMYMMEFLRDCPTLEKAVPQAAEVRMIVGTGEVVVGIFCVIFLIYRSTVFFILLEFSDTNPSIHISAIQQTDPPFSDWKKAISEK